VVIEPEGLGMELGWSAADLAFRDEVREFLDRELTPELRGRAG
jgi:hypothetical protein